MEGKFVDLYKLPGHRCAERVHLHTILALVCQLKVCPLHVRYKQNEECFHIQASQTRMLSCQVLLLSHQPAAPDSSVAVAREASTEQQCGRHNRHEMVTVCLV